MSSKFCDGDKRCQGLSAARYERIEDFLKVNAAIITAETRRQKVSRHVVNS